jgi:hypothetical protein
LRVLISSHTSIDFRLLMYGLVHGNQLSVATMVSVNNLHTQNLVLSKSIALVKLLATLGYNANVGIDSVVEFQGLWFYFEFLTHKILFFFIPFLFGYNILVLVIEPRIRFWVLKKI